MTFEKITPKIGLHAPEIPAKKHPTKIKYLGLLYLNTLEKFDLAFNGAKSSSIFFYSASSILFALSS